MSEAFAYPDADYELRPYITAPYTNRDDLVDEIELRLASGETLTSISRDAHMPSWVTLYSWIGDESTDVYERLRRARDAGHDAIASHALQIADDKTGDPQRDKLRIDTRLKLLAKWNPRKYGESTQLRHADADGGKLDTGPLVGELLGLMQPGASPPAESQAQPAARAIAAPRVSYREITPAAAQPAQSEARPAGKAYRPRAARDDVGDLV